MEQVHDLVTIGKVAGVLWALTLGLIGYIIKSKDKKDEEMSEKLESLELLLIKIERETALSSERLSNNIDNVKEIKNKLETFNAELSKISLETRELVIFKQATERRLGDIELQLKKQCDGK